MKVTRARRWPTTLTSAQFKRATGQASFPDFLRKDLDAQANLNVFANGEVNYTLRGVHVKVTARWEFEPAPGAKDSHYSLLKGSKANLLIKQGPEENYVATLYIEGKPDAGPPFESALRKAIAQISDNYPATDL